MSEQKLSTVQQLWRDRREEFEAYLRGEMTVLVRGKYYPNPPFCDHEGWYEFRPLPKPPKMRPLTRDEWIERMREDWFVKHKDATGIHRINAISDVAVFIAGLGKYSFQIFLDEYEMSPDCINFQQCGIEVSE